MIVKIVMRHFPNCNADYPEKVPGEKPQEIDRVDIGDGDVAYTCVDCGASVVVKVEEGASVVVTV